MKILPIDRHQYAARLQASEQDCPFLAPEWLEAAADSVNGRVRFLASEELRGLLPLVEREFGPVRIAGSPLRKTGTPVALPLPCAPGEERRWLSEVANWAKASSCALVQVTSPIPPEPEWGCDRVELFENLEIDLSVSCDALWKQLSDLPRRMIKRALRNGFKAHLSPNSGASGHHQSLVNGIYAMQNQKPIYKKRHYAAVQTPPLARALDTLSISRNGRVVGSLMSLRDAQRAYYWDVAVEHDARAEGAGHLLLWAWLRWCKRHGLQTADLMGPPSGGRGSSRPGIGRFKLSFGARPRPYWILYWHSWWAGKALDLARKLS